MKKKNCVVIISILLILLGSVLTGCSSEDFDLYTSPKTIAKRKASMGNERIEADNTRIPITNLPCNLGSFKARIHWYDGDVDNLPAIHLVTNTFDDITYRIGYLFTLLALENDMYNDVYVTGIEPDPVNSTFNFTSICGSMATISYTIPCKVYLLDAIQAETNDSTSISTSKCFEHKAGKDVSITIEGSQDIPLTPNNL